MTTQQLTPPSTARFWDRAAEKYARDPITDPAAYEYTLGRTRSYLRSGDHVLEIGAGTSSTAIALAPHVARYHATDISPEMVRIGREKAQAVPGLEISVAPADFAFPPDHDAVLALNLLHLVPDVGHTIERARAALRPGGLFISKTPCLGDAGFLKRGLFRVMIAGMALAGKAPKPVHFLTAAALEAQIAAKGFEIVETARDGTNAPRRYIVARKL